MGTPIVVELAIRDGRLVARYPKSLAPGWVQDVLMERRSELTALLGAWPEAQSLAVSLAPRSAARDSADTTDTTPRPAVAVQTSGARHYPVRGGPGPEIPAKSGQSVGTAGCRLGAGTPSLFDQRSRPDVTASVGSIEVVSEADLKEPAFMLVSEAKDLTVVRASVEQTALVGLDTETTGLDPRADRVRLLSLACDTVGSNSIVYLIDCFAVDPSQLWPALAEADIVGHNLTFDLQFLARLGFTPGRVRDTMLMSQVLHAGERGVRHSLAEAVSRHLGRQLDKAGQLTDWSARLTDAQLRYAALDAEVVRELHGTLRPKLEAVGLDEVAAIEHEALPALAWMAGAGVAIDSTAWQALAHEAGQEAERFAAELDAAAPAPLQKQMFGAGWNWDSPKQVAEALRLAGCAVEKTNDDTLAALDHPLASLLRRYRAAKKLLGTYGEAWLQHVAPDSRVYAGWHQLGADSGRMACSKPNLQNLPRDVRYRRCFVAPPGRALVKADYSQIELRIAAKLAGEGSMIDAYARGDDLHALTARHLLGKEEVTKEDRQLAKSVNFGLLYGMGANGFRDYARSNYGVELTEAQAQEYRERFFRAYPGLARWHRRVRDANAPETRTVAGRRRPLDRETPLPLRLNAPVQGTGADALKRALALLWKRRADCPGAIPVLAVHDEIVVECPAGSVEEAKNWLRRAMADAFGVWIEPIPVEVEVRTGQTWAG
jgi:DNA polymerase I